MRSLEPPCGPGSDAGSSRSGILLLLLLFAMLAGGAAPLEAQADRPEVLSLSFEGNDAFSDEALSSAIITRATECRSLILRPFCLVGADFAFDEAYLNPRDFRDDVARLFYFYYLRGYREARVDTLVTRPRDDAVHIGFRIREGRPIIIDSIEVAGLEELGNLEQDLVARLPAREGGSLSLIALDASRDSLLTRLRNRGYPHAEIFRGLDIPADEYTASVFFDVFTGPRARYGTIEIQGNSKVSEVVVRRMLPFSEGDVYSREAIFDGQRNLFNLEIFRHADIVQDLQSSPDTLIPLTVRVNEGNVHRVRTGAGWSTAECFNSEARWSSRNFFGGARRLEVRGRVSNLLAQDLENSICNESGSGVYGRINWLASAEFVQPWIFSPRNSFNASVYFERQSLPDVFVRSALGVNLGLTRSLGRASPLTLTYRPQWAELDAAEIFFCTSFQICDPQDIAILQGTNRLSPIGLGFTRDRANRVVNPSGGYTATLDFEHASGWTGSDFVYDRFIGEFTKYWEVASDLVSAYRVRTGWLNSGPFQGLSEMAQGRVIDHPQKRFFAGGANSVRGYAQNQLGPRVLTVPVERLLFTDDTEDPTPAPTCSPQEIIQLTCDAGELHDDVFFPRPTGGDALIEGNVELRIPIGSEFQVATFLDFGKVWDEQNRFTFDQLDLSPGLGMRYLTPVGPIRVDIAYRFGSGDRLPVITSQIRPFDPEIDAPDDRIGAEGREIPYVLSSELAPLGPRVLFDEADAWSLRRIQLHFSIGQAF